MCECIEYEDKRYGKSGFLCEACYPRWLELSARQQESRGVVVEIVGADSETHTFTVSWPRGLTVRTGDRHTLTRIPEQGA